MKRQIIQVFYDAGYYNNNCCPLAVEPTSVIPQLLSYYNTNRRYRVSNCCQASLKRGQG
ncbi:hypothetical protein SH449x_004806 [Pirellulaceae bacterium SH449]